MPVTPYKMNKIHQLLVCLYCRYMFIRFINEGMKLKALQGVSFDNLAAFTRTLHEILEKKNIVMMMM